MNSFKEGDVVQLKSGGPEMTVKSVTKTGYICVWFLSGKVERAVFSEAELQLPKQVEKK